MKISSQIFCDQNILPFSRWTKDISKAIPRFLIEEMLSPARWTQSEISVPQHEPTNPSPELTAQPKSLPKRSIPFSLNLSSNTLKALGSSAFAVAAIGTYFLLSRTGSSSLPIQQMSSGNDTPTAPVFSQPGHLENILSGPSPLPLSTSPWNDTPAAHTSVSSGIPDSELFLPSPLPTSPWKNQLVQSFSSPQLSALDQCPADKIAKNPISNQIAAVKKFFSKTFIYSNVCDYLWEKPKNFIWISFYEYGYNLFYSTPNASKLEERGRQLLEIFEIDLPSNADFKNNPADLSYRKNFMDQSQCPVGLEDYISYQIENGYFNNLNPDALKDLFGDEPYLTDAEARALYHLIDKQGISHMDRLLNERDLKKALIASLIRTNALEHTRGRMKNQDTAKILYRRDKIVYGTYMRNLFYFLGKCGNETNETAIAECLKRSATKTNALVDLINLNLFSKVTSSFYDAISKAPSIFKLNKPIKSTDRTQQTYNYLQFGTQITQPTLGYNVCRNKG